MIIHKLAGVVCAFALTAGAATVTFDFTTSGGTPGGTSPFGNTRTYTNGIYSVTASAFSLPANLAGNFTTAQLNQYNGFGLAVCDQAEGANCNDPLHQVDNSGEFDFVLFKFNFAADPTTIFINPFNSWDRDVTYWVGNNAANLSTLTLGGLGMGSRLDDNSTSSSSGRTVTLLGGTGNALLIAARLSGNSADGNIDRFKIENLTVETAVPEPATFGLAGLALAGLGWLRRRVRAS